MNKVLTTAASYWLYPLASDALVFHLVELEKFIISKLKQASKKGK
jgi:hypothetical protein